MTKIATSFVNRYKLTPQTSLPQLSSYAEELANKLSDSKTKEQARKARDQAKRRFQELGLSKEQVDTLIPIRAPGRHVEGRDPIKIIARDIINNDLSPEEINGIAYELASSTPNVIAGNSRLNLLRKELRILGAEYHIIEATKIPPITEKANQKQARKRVLRGIRGFDWPEFFYLEKVQERLNECDITKVQERLNECDITKPPSMQNLIDIMVMLCMRSADVETLHQSIQTNEVGEPRPFLSMEKNPIRARELLIWIQRSIPDKFPFLLKDKDGNTNVVPLNQFLSRHRITSVHGGKNDTGRQYLRQLACRHKIGHASSVEHYGVMNDRPNMCLDTSSAIPAPRPIAPMIKQEYDEIEDFYDLYGISRLAGNS
ncbi:hypothetical protein Glove_330g79 [Diversispora epigaea]|uniref:Uncharacterized protein n=1 Tax=Diversispora epigaea TaxID=1348612 RepID=A0A397HJM1_9GLOM|nr:hypothetical protein Glove_330g79 [Diversispora epigaea]